MKKNVFFAAVVLLVLLCAACSGAEEVVKLPVDLSGGMPYSSENLLSDSIYEDESLRVEITEQMVGVTRVLIARVRIKDPSQLRSAPAYSFDRDQTAPMTSIAKRVHAVLAINGDYYSYQAARGGYMIRQGVQYIDRPIKGRDVLIIDGNGDFHIELEITEEFTEKYEALGGIVNSFNFGPGIIIDGVLQDRFDGMYNSSDMKAARSCIAQVKRGELEYLCIVTESSDDSKGGGLTLREFAEFVAKLDVENAYNLDGGNSAALIFMGEKMNSVDDRDHRPLSDIIYFASAMAE
ncbi:MAG: phosphodiester glycosidase family protein [Clostridia bacterium]|nr:phosphodiester glycosidase family protein [Clostridia bacterium]